jgi:hypothetical protein
MEATYVRFHRQRRAGRGPASFVALLILLSAPASAFASNGSDAPEQSAVFSAAQSAPNPDFLFGRPKGSLGVRSGWLFASAGGDVLDFVRNELTIDRKDFNAPVLAVDLGAVVSRRVDVLFGFEYSRSSIDSEYRHFVDNDRLPIAQRTRLQQLNLTSSARIAVVPRGREVGRLAWIARPVTPYVGAGGGVLRYKFEQSGDFVDFVDLSVFGASLQSSGWTPSAHVFVGADVKLQRRMFFAVEARYLWAKAAPGKDFIGFDRIDLTGVKLTGGLNFLF